MFFNNDENSFPQLIWGDQLLEENNLSLKLIFEVGGRRTSILVFHLSGGELGSEATTTVDRCSTIKWAGGETDKQVFRGEPPPAKDRLEYPVPQTDTGECIFDYFMSENGFRAM